MEVSPMPDENRFAGLGEQITPEERDDAASDDGSDGDAESEDLAESDGGPAFEFDETKAKSIYVRPDTLQMLEDAEFEVESILRREHGVRDLAGREFHDAAVRAIANNPEAVAELILDLREKNAD